MSSEINEHLKNTAVLSHQNSNTAKIEISEPQKLNNCCGKGSNQYELKQFSDPDNVDIGSRSRKRSRFEDIFLKSDIHGFPEWYQAEQRSTKLCWTAILILTFVLLIYGLIKCSKDFADNPILTTYSVVGNTMGRGIPFPDLYFCPLIPVHDLVRSQSDVNKTWEKEMRVSEYFEASTKIYGKEGGILKKKTKIWEQIGGNVAQSQSAPIFFQIFGESPIMLPDVWTPKNIQEYFMDVGYKVSTLFQECAFNSKPINCEDIITPFFDRDYGKCFILRRNFSQTLPGIGLSLVINLDLANAIDVDSKNRPLFDGIIMKVDHEFDPGNYRKIYLKPGLNTQATLEVKKFNLIERERPGTGMQRCVDNDAGKQNLEVVDAKYSVGVCHMDCVQQFVISKCSCALAMDYSLIKDDVKKRFLEQDIFCNVTHRKHCADEIIETAQENKNLQECTGGCKVPCEFYEYKTELSFLNFPSYSISETNGINNPATPLPSASEYTLLPLVYEHFTTTEPNWVKNDRSNHAQLLRNIEERANNLNSNGDFAEVYVQIGNLFDNMTEKSDWSMKNIDWYGLTMDLKVTLGKLSSAKTPQDAMRWLIDLQSVWSEDYKNLTNLIEENLGENSRRDNIFIQFFVELRNLSQDIGNFDFPISILLHHIKWAAISHDNDFLQLFNESNIYSSWKLITDYITLLDELNKGESLPEFELAKRISEFWKSNSLSNVSVDFLEQAESILAKKPDNKFKKVAQTVSNLKLLIKKSFKLLDSMKNDEQLRKKRDSNTEQPPSYEQMKNNYIVLDVAFASLQYIEVTQEPSMTFDTFVSNIGGQVGLWVGASIVTVFKFFTILWPIILEKCGLSETTNSV